MPTRFDARARNVERSGFANTVELPSWMVGDLLILAVFLSTLAEHIGARSNYAIYPYLAPLTGIFLVVAFPKYRKLMANRLVALWGRAEDFSQGSASIPWLAAATFVVFPAWLLYLSNQRTMGATDTRPVVPTAVSLLREGNFELSEYFVPGAKLSLRNKDGAIRDCFRQVRGGIYSAYPTGMVPFALISSGLAKLARSDLDDPQVQRRLEKLTAAALASLSLGFFYLTALKLAPPAASLTTTAILAVGSGMFSTVSMALWQHGGIIFWSSLLIFAEFRQAERPSLFKTLCQGLCCGMLVTCRLTSASFLVPFGIWIMLLDLRRAAIMISFAMTCYFPWACFYFSVYGNPFGPSTSFLAGRLWNPDLLGPLAGVLISPSRGLVIYQPWVMLVPLAFVWGRSESSTPRDQPVGWRMFCLSAVGAHVLLIAVWGCWWGGWCWGSRLLVDIVPMCGLLCVPPIARLRERRWGKSLILLLAMVAVMMQVAGVYWNTTPWNARAVIPDDLWSWEHAPFLEPFTGEGPIWVSP